MYIIIDLIAITPVREFDKSVKVSNAVGNISELNQDLVFPIL